jgi:peroxiredoxin
MADLHSTPRDLPIPADDGAAVHLPGARLPAVVLAANRGETVDLADAADGTLVVYVYPATGVPGRPLPTGWDEVPGARGCTPQSCAFRDHVRDLDDLGASVMGLSAQSAAEQREFAEREHIPYPLLNDSEFVFAAELGIPTFELDAVRYYRRLTLIARAGQIAKVFYPVFPPQQNAAEVVAWLRATGPAAGGCA